VTILTEWNEFRALDLKRVRGMLKTPVMVDLRNIYNPEDMDMAGFEYYSIGRPARTAADGLLNVLTHVSEPPCHR